MKRKVLVAVPFAVVLAALVTFLCVRTGTGMAQGAQAIGEDVIYVGEHITVTQSDYDSYLKRAQLLNPDQDMTQVALDNIAMREIWCYLGHEAGIPDDDEAFAAWFKQYRETVESADNYEDVLPYLGGTEMTPEEYWQWAETDESFRKDWYATLYPAQLQEEFQAQQSDEMLTTWNEYLRIYKEKALENEHLKKVNKTK